MIIPFWNSDNHRLVKLETFCSSSLSSDDVSLSVFHKPLIFIGGFVICRDNTEWEQELDEFGVEGILHFAFLDRQGNEEGNVVGRLPRQYLVENVNALAAGKQSIPHARAVGQYSSAEAP
ncbi:hypothetical protein Bca52824_090504 [Brassica carinata]|uniref:Uncharacterized protein n=1 Tax=Brassica carinata TaxID=52824 RepID=A0A8X7NZQ5_BRACI|nr:hypothetical protein Bca52824_090504 [Brassica carinata]